MPNKAVKGSMTSEQLEALTKGLHADPFAVLGVHRVAGVRLVRAFQPQADSVLLINIKGERLALMTRIHGVGVFESVLPTRLRHYRFRIIAADGSVADYEDPYRFPTTLGDLDLHLLGEGSHQRIYETLGTQCFRVLGVQGTRFAVWAPNAARVSVVGDFNDWDGRRHVMRVHPANGIWEIFIPGVGSGALYKFELLDAQNRPLPLKTDPLSRLCESPPGNASIVYESHYSWADDQWMRQRPTDPNLAQPISIYEVHLGSWRRDAGTHWLNYRNLADLLIIYLKEMGFTHIELLPITEHPFDGSWGYQPIGLYAPTHRFGVPDDFRYFVDRCHQAGIGVILDWVPAHFPRDPNGLGRFDGSALYEHEDPRKGEHADWGTLIFNYGRREVVNYLIGSALSWIDEFHLDGLRVDAVASMLYLDYSRKDGEWLANELGGNENLEAVAFLKQLNSIVHARGAMTFAEESTAWPGVSTPVEYGGLGFTFKWNMGWMNDTLKYMGEDPVHRKYHHDKMTFGLVYAFDENFILPLSHDEVVHGKRSLLARMPGDHWQRLANLRAYYGFMFGHPGKKLLFMGAEIAQELEWSHDQELGWDLLQDPGRRGVQHLVRDLNRLYQSTPPLYEIDHQADGFEWIDFHNGDESVLSWLRRDLRGNHVICVSNLTPVVRERFRIGVPDGNSYQELLNTDHVGYGGSGVVNAGKLQADAIAAHGRPYSLLLNLPPLATMMLAPESSAHCI